jgi:hypothetical protein
VPTQAAASAPIDPRLRGQQASPAPQREPLPIAKIAIGAGVALVLVFVVCGRGGDEDDASEPPPAVVVDGDAQAQSEELAPLAGRDRPEIIHAEAWEKTAEALGELDKHLNRAKLIFQDIDAEEARTAAAMAPPPSPPSGPESGSEVGSVPPPEPVPAGPPPGQAEARSIWSGWHSDWKRDLDVASSMLPSAKKVDNKLAPGFQAVSALFGQAGQTPGGHPPPRSARDGWLRKLQNESVAVRRKLEMTR